jgi:DMSO/TMAO reductase YedYZ heme-binding membrane subunit
MMTGQLGWPGRIIAMSSDEKKLPPDRLWQPVTAKWFFVIFGACLAYAVVRYHIAGDVAWRHFPLFILNKAISMAAVFFVGASYLIGKIIHWYDHDAKLRLVVIKFCGLLGFFFATIHAIMSLILLNPGYFAKYFDEAGRLNLQGEVGMSVGILALMFLLSPAITTLPMMPKALGGWRWKRSQRVGYLALLLVSFHLVALGLKGWLAPNGWTAGLPPISLVAFLAAVFPLLVKRKTVAEREQKKKEREEVQL